ncbi:MAG: hypothetical protein ACFFA6_13160 [Promethearchaeota archaeon]
MDIAKFNKELATKIAIAKSLERSNEITAAIKLWVEISEMTLRFSKSRGLNFSFRNMLIKRTEGILHHIQNLKSGKGIEDRLVKETESKLEEPPSQELREIDSPEEINSKGAKIENLSIKRDNKSNGIDTKEVKVIDDSEFKNIPDGFKEIHPAKDFKIVTPHDEEYVEKLLKKSTDMSILTPKKGEDEQIQSKIELEQPKDNNKLICFACGAELPAKTKICPDCGSNLN